MGPLASLRVLELAALGPIPFVGMALADLGATVTRVDRFPGRDLWAGPAGHQGPLGRGRRSICIDLRTSSGAGLVRRLAADCDLVLEGMRPGVAERLGVGPADLMGANDALIYGRITGFGSTGPLADDAGHDLTYLARTGVLHAIGPSDGPPTPPLNLVADFAGGSMPLLVGLLAAVIERSTSGRGQVVEVAMDEGAAYLATMTRALLQSGAWQDVRAANLLDGGAPHYRCYRTADSTWLAVAALEPQFWAELLDVLGLASADLPSPHDHVHWASLSDTLAQRIEEHPADEWVRRAAGRDACLAPVLPLAAAPSDAHARTRNSYGLSAGATVARPPMRLSRTPASIATEPPVIGCDTDAVLRDLGVPDAERSVLRATGVVATAS